MTDLANRTEFEEAIAGKLSRTLSAQERALLSLLGDPPDINKIPPTYWTEFGAAILTAIVGTMTEVYMTSAETISATLPIGVDWALVNEGAAQWARTASFDLIRGLTDTTRRVVNESVSNFYTMQQTRADLVRSLTPTFGPRRAEMIAITEVTNAATAGEQGIARELAKEGVNMVPFWTTRNDELVCPICGPKNGKEITDGKFPAAHPRCRCSVRYELPKVRR